MARKKQETGKEEAIEEKIAEETGKIGPEQAEPSADRADKVSEKITDEKTDEKIPEIVDEAAVKLGTEEEKEAEIQKLKASVKLDSWVPKTELGRKVKSGAIKDIRDIFDNGLKIFEPEIVDFLVPNMDIDLLLIGQSKGKFGGGQRRVFKQTQKKTMEGNKPKFSAYAVIGNHDGIIGCGFGKAKETVPAREKSFRNARLSITMIKRGCGSWECGCKQPHSIPYTVEGKCGSVTVKLMPAPKGKGLVTEKECQKILKLAGIKDVYSKSYGNTGTKINLVMACINALKNLMATKTLPKHRGMYGIIDGPSDRVEYTNLEEPTEENE